MPQEKDLISTFKELYCLNETNLKIYGNWNSMKIKGLVINLEKCTGSNCAIYLNCFDKLYDQSIQIVFYFSDTLFNFKKKINFKKFFRN